MIFSVSQTRLKADPFENVTNGSRSPNYLTPHTFIPNEIKCLFQFYSLPLCLCQLYLNFPSTVTFYNYLIIRVSQSSAARHCLPSSASSLHVTLSYIIYWITIGSELGMMSEIIRRAQRHMRYKNQREKSHVSTFLLSLGEFKYLMCFTVCDCLQYS